MIQFSKLKAYLFFGDELNPKNMLRIDLKQVGFVDEKSSFLYYMALGNRVDNILIQSQELDKQSNSDQVDLKFSNNYAQ